jgi:TPR repeat protein
MALAEQILDTELANHFGSKFGLLYAESVEYIDTLPTYALLRMRMALEELCNHLGSPVGSRLEERINALDFAGKITFAVKDLLHSTRIKCNAALHHSMEGVRQKEGEAPLPEGQLKGNAEKTRHYIIDALQQLFEKRPGGRRLTVTKAKHESQPAMKAMYLAATSNNAEDKYRAGQLCEAMATNWQRSETALIVSEDFAEHINYLRSLAAMHFRSANRLKPSIEAQFRYAVLVEQGLVDGEEKVEARAMIKASADSGLGEACDYHGALLWESNDFHGAKRYWEKAHQRGWPRACAQLTLLFESDKLGDPQLELALKFAKEGAEQEDPDSLYHYGRFFYEGLGVPEDKEKGEALISQAEAMWCGAARNYRLLNIENIADKLHETFLGFMKQMEEASAANKAAKTIRRQPLPGRNEPCHCESGKKYKKCCGQ